MPTWPAFRRQPDTVKADWNVMWKALKRHEEGHKRRFLKRFGKLIRDIESLRDAKGGDIDILGTKALNEIEEKQRKYDEKTDHGRSKGVTLHVP